MASLNLFSLLFLLMLTISGGFSAAVAKSSGSRLTRISSTAADVFNGTSISALGERSWKKSCSTKPGSGIGDTGSCYCWNHDGAFSDTKQIHAAVDEFCAWISTISWQMGWKEDVFNTYPNDDGSGTLLLKFDATGDMDTMVCRNNINISVDDCTSGFKAVKGHCDTEGGRPKIVSERNYGGYGYDACYKYTIDPNPNIHNPCITLSNTGGQC